MSGGHGDADGPEFRHIFKVYDEDGTGEARGADTREDIKDGEISDLDELQEEDKALGDIVGDPYKTLKVVSGTQGTPYTTILQAVDKFDDDWEWEIPKTEEKMFVTPESNLHNEFMQRKQQAEQNVRQAMQGLEQLRKQKHLLQHDVRKLRSKVEDMRTGEETTIKGDFIELVDGAGQSARQGGDSMALKAYRDQNIYPSIVADFNEMESIDDLLTAEKKAEKHGGDPEDYEDGPLASIPENEKAILKKKYTMYEKWKDLYGSEIQRKLEDIKKELRRVERAEEEQKESVAPYVRDMVMINQKSQEELADDMQRYFQYRGYSTQFREMEFIAYQPCVKHHGDIEETDGDHVTHYKVVYVKAVHVNIAGGENPNSPAEGPTIAKVMWHPMFMDKFIFEDFFEKKIDRKANQFESLMEDYTGEFENEAGEEFQEAREKAGLSIRKLRQKIGEEIGESPPLELSSTIRRIEDGFDRPEVIKTEYDDGEKYLEIIDDLIDTSYASGEEEERDGGRFEDLKDEIKLFTGQEDEYYVSEGEVDDLHADLLNRMKFSYYFDLKLTLGLKTMK